MLLVEMARGFGVRVAALAAGLILSSMIVLGGAIYTLIDDVLERLVAERIEDDTSRLLGLSAPNDAKELIAEVARRTREDVSRRYAYRLADNNGRHVAGDHWVGTGKPGWSKQPTSSQVDGAISGGQILALTTRVEPNLVLSIGRDIQWIADVEAELLRLLRWALLGGLALSVLTAYLTMRLVAHRIDLVVRSAHSIMEGNLKQRVPVTGARDDFDHLSQTLNEMLDRIQGLIDDIEQVTNDIAHDLRSPLGRLRQGLELARSHAATTDDYARAVDHAISEADGMLATFTALLRIAQVEAGGSRSHFREVDLSEALRSVAEAYELEAENSGHQLRTAIAHGVVVTGDRDLLVQAFANLIENGLIHTPAGSTITLALEHVAGGVAASVADNGQGVPAEERVKIFQRFYRLELSRTSPGTGLGLSLVAAVAKLHGAPVDVGDSRPGLRISLTFSTAGTSSPQITAKAAARPE